MLDFAHSKERMIANHLEWRGITDQRVLDAMRSVPREAFVEPGSEEFAYEDSPLPIGEGQTISQPYIVALMAQEAEIDPNDIVLEVGTGSGYAAAVIGRIARHVYTIERHASLAQSAKRCLTKLGYDNVDVRIGDGTKGWPEVGPFNAIIVAAGGESIPTALQEQLDLGGRLIIPVGRGEVQRLMKIIRINATTFEEHDLGGVRFVPLISDRNGTESVARVPADVAPPATLPQMIAAAAERLPDFDDPEFGALFDRFGDRRVVLLGEASHGTSEFYRARDIITRRLIEKHGFNVVAVEADWPDAAVLDRYVRDRPVSDSLKSAKPFQRFPKWMWRNREVAAFVDWLKVHNTGHAPEDRIGFYGLDIYNLSASIAIVLAYLDKIDPDAANIARQRYGCLTPWQNEPSTYGRAVLTSGFHGCQEEVIRQCRDLLERRLEYSAGDGDDFMDASQSARLIASAERYYRVMYYGGAEAWNLRDEHMFDTLRNLLDARGPNSKAVVWAHNSHIGDARQTDMAGARDEINIGQRCREHFGDQAALVGFGMHSGRVAAASDWDSEMEIKTVRLSHPESYEHLFHDSGVDRFLVDFARHPQLSERLREPRLERFIGVIYQPETERLSHYSYASLPRQFDAFVWFDWTNPVSPFGADAGSGGMPETFPFGV